jgi:hypothetical protein
MLQGLGSHASHSTRWDEPPFPEGVESEKAPYIFTLGHDGVPLQAVNEGVVYDVEAGGA